METLLLDEEAVGENARTEEVIEAVAAAFAAYERGDAQMPAKSYIDLPEYNGDFRSMPAYMDAGEWDAAGIKWVNVHPDNPEKFDLPTVLGTMIYSDPETARPLAIMDGTELTMQRTGAAAAVATDLLAREDARSLGLVGAGVQSYTQVEAIAAVRPIEEIVVSDLDEAAIEGFVDHFGDRFDVRGGSIAEAAACDVLSTVTPSTEPLVSHEDLGEHTHVNAMGADAADKQELDPAILREARVVIDDHAQTTHSGEISIPYADGVIDDDDIDGAVGEIVVGEVSAHGTGVANLDVADLAGGLDERRQRGPDVGLEELGVGRQRTDRHGVAVDVDPVDPRDRADVDQRVGRGQPGLHRREQAVSAGDELGVVVLFEQRERLVHAVGPVVVELVGVHLSRHPRRARRRPRRRARRRRTRRR